MARRYRLVGKSLSKESMAEKLAYYYVHHPDFYLGIVLKMVKDQLMNASKESLEELLEDVGYKD